MLKKTMSAQVSPAPEKYSPPCSHSQERNTGTAEMMFLGHLGSQDLLHDGQPGRQLLLLQGLRQLLLPGNPGQEETSGTVCHLASSFSYITFTTSVTKSLMASTA